MLRVHIVALAAMLKNAGSNISTSSMNPPQCEYVLPAFVSSGSKYESTSQRPCGPTVTQVDTRIKIAPRTQATVHQETCSRYLQLPWAQSCFPLTTIQAVERCW